MNKVLIAAMFGAIMMPSVPAFAHNVWCHCPQKSQKATLNVFKQAEKVTDLQRGMMNAWYSASVAIEHGVIAEFEHKIYGTPVEPEHFRETLEGLQEVRVLADKFNAELIAFRVVATKNPEANFTAALSSISKEANLTRVLSKGARYSNVAGSKTSAATARVSNAPGCGGVVDVLVADLKELVSLLDETIAATRDAIPLAEQGDFAVVMLSGRNKFGDKMPQLTDAFSRYDRLYVEQVLTTISATMQVFPSGFEFLKN